MSGPRRTTRGRRGVLTMAAACAVALAASAGWSQTAHAAPDARTVATTTPVGQLVVKLAPGVGVDRVNQRLGSRTGSSLLASRSIYLLDVPLDSPDPDSAKQQKAWQKQADKLVKSLTKSGDVVYAEPNRSADITEGERFHYWPDGEPACTGTDPTGYRTQKAVVELALDAAHGEATGANAVVAVLDTGVDLAHPALAGRLAPGGYDYVDDDPTPQEAGDQVDQDGDTRVDEGYGHGTFVAGILALVAPQAKILPQRVLDSDGRGNVFTVAEAIYDSVARGADVINMSFGTEDKPEPRVLTEALKAATKAGVVLVAAAGNDGSKNKHYPAAMSDVVSVGALTADGAALTPFSARGDWVDLAAPGEKIVSLLPCGYGTWSGTSMAAPFVAGAAALEAGSRGADKPDAKGERIRRSAVKVKGVPVHDGVLNLARLLRQK